MYLAIPSIGRVEFLELQRADLIDEITSRRFRREQGRTER